jgi:hypothetical protein
LRWEEIASLAGCAHRRSLPEVSVAVLLPQPSDPRQAVGRLGTFGMTKVKLPRQLYLCGMDASHVAQRGCSESWSA